MPFYYRYPRFLNFEIIREVFNYFLISLPLLWFRCDGYFVSFGVKRFDVFFLGIGLHKERYYLVHQIYSLIQALEIFIITFFPLFLLVLQIREIDFI
jgi:hypothetical protein